jgi:hypothetical protein
VSRLSEQNTRLAQEVAMLDQRQTAAEEARRREALERDELERALSE